MQIHFLAESTPTLFAVHWQTIFFSIDSYSPVNFYQCTATYNRIDKKSNRSANFFAKTVFNFLDRQYLGRQKIA